MSNQPNYKLDELLAQCDPEAPPGEIDWGPDVGLERLDYLPELLTAAFDDVQRARAKQRGQPRYTLEELLAQCDQNAMPPSEMN